MFQVQIGKYLKFVLAGTLEYRYEYRSNIDIGGIITGIVVPLLLIVVALTIAFVILCMHHKRKQTLTSESSAMIPTSKRFVMMHVLI